MQKQVKVEGVPEVRRAFDKVARDVSDLSEAHRAEVEMLLPDVKAATRRASGQLEEAWGVDSTATEAQFINEMDYAGVQEWGWPDHNIEPTHAITGAFEKNSSQTEEIYGTAIERAGERARLRTS